MFRFAALLSVLVLFSACDILDPPECRPALQASLAYRYDVNDQTTESTASIGVARNPREDETIIVLRDTSRGETEITMQIPDPLTAGEIILDDPSASYPPEHVPPIRVRETSPDDSDVGSFQGSVTIRELSASNLILSFDLTMYLARRDPMRLYGETLMLDLQTCS